MINNIPEQKYVVLHPVIDGRNWDHYKPRNNDIIVCTPLKSGTTWMRQIVNSLISLNMDIEINEEFVTWIEMIIDTPIIERSKYWETITYRRCFKTHLPLDSIPYYPQVKYIIVNRDPRDVFMSLWNHYSNVTQERIEKINNQNKSEKIFPKCPSDIKEYWNWFINKGWFSWENEGYPYWSILRNARSWWNFRYLPNFLFIHFNNLQKSLTKEIIRVASFISIPITDNDLSFVVASASLENMRKKSVNNTKTYSGFKNGSQSFFEMGGSNNRWKSVLSDIDQENYDRKAKKELTPECRNWLENGEFI